MTNMSFNLMGHHLLPPTSNHSIPTTPHCLQNPKSSLQNSTRKPIILPSLLSLALTVTLGSPLPVLAIPSFNTQSNLAPPPPPTTPFSQAKNLKTGLEFGYTLVFSSSIRCFFNWIFAILIC